MNNNSEIVAKVVSTITLDVDLVKVAIEISQDRGSDYQIIDLYMNEQEVKINYPQDWAIYNENFLLEDNAIHSFKQIYEEAEQEIEGYKIYISKEDELQIVRQIKESLKNQFESEFDQVITVESKNKIFQKINKLIEELK